MSAFCASPLFVQPQICLLLGSFFQVHHVLLCPSPPQIQFLSTLAQVSSSKHCTDFKQSRDRDWRRAPSFQSVSPSKPPRESAKSTSESGGGGHRRHHHHHHHHHHPQSSSSNNSSSPESTVCLSSSWVHYRKIPSASPVA